MSRLFLFLSAVIVSTLMTSRAQAQAPTVTFDGQRAMQYLVDICKIGPRISGTAGMTKQQEMIESHFNKLGADVKYQDFDISHPQTGAPVRMRNMIITWNTAATDRLLLCCHYDTRPHPDQEPTPALRNMPFIGANDGGSGVAMMMELGNQLAAMETKPAVDFVIFDGEELVYKPGDKYFYGSEFFSKAYVNKGSNPVTYHKGLLLDMVAGKDAKFYYELNSLRYAPEVTKEIWDIARDVGVKEFIARRRHEVQDDHIPLNLIAKIPTCDVIDFDYPHWHRRNDVPAACSPVTMTKVGRVVLAWFERAAP